MFLNNCISVHTQTQWKTFGSVFKCNSFCHITVLIVFVGRVFLALNARSTRVRTIVNKRRRCHVLLTIYVCTYIFYILIAIVGLYGLYGFETVAVIIFARVYSVYAIRASRQRPTIGCGYLLYGLSGVDITSTGKPAVAYKPASPYTRVFILGAAIIESTTYSTRFKSRTCDLKKKNFS